MSGAGAIDGRRAGAVATASADLFGGSPLLGEGAERRLAPRARDQLRHGDIKKNARCVRIRNPPRSR